MLFSLSKVVVLPRQPILPFGAVYVEVQRVFEGYHAVLHVGGDEEDLPLTDGDVTAWQSELEGSRENVRELLALVLLDDHDASLLQEDLGGHHLLS